MKVPQTQYLISYKPIYTSFFCGSDDLYKNQFLNFHYSQHYEFAVKTYCESMVHAKKLVMWLTPQLIKCALTVLIPQSSFLLPCCHRVARLYHFVIIESYTGVRNQHWSEYICLSLVSVDLIFSMAQLCHKTKQKFKNI